MDGLPRLLNVEDDLRRAESATENDISDDVDDVRNLLDEYADRTRERTADDRTGEGDGDEDQSAGGVSAEDEGMEKPLDESLDNEEIDNEEIDERVGAVDGRETADGDRAGDGTTDSGTAGEGVLDEIEQVLLRLQEQCSDDAEEYFQSARNRVGIFRDSVSGDGDGVTVVSTRRTSGGRRSEYEVTAVNNTDGQVDGRAMVTFYDDDGEELDTATSEQTTYEAGEEKPVRVSADPPDGSSRFTASVERS
jgi:hypothetical protein